MIRIDLGKEDLGAKKKPAFLSGVTLPSWFPDINKIRVLVTGKLSIGVAIAVACLFPLFFSQYKSYLVSQYDAKKKTLNDRIDLLGQEVQKFTPFQKELESYEQQRKVISERLDTVRSLLESRNTPVNILDAVGQSLPPRVWAGQISLSLLPEKASLVIQGKSLTNEEISDFVDKLSESVHLSDVSLEEVANAQVDKVEIKTFQINARPKIKALPAAKPAEPARAVAANPKPAAVTPGKN
jgi:Tfp pilus assembly protein PilN